MIPVSIDRQVAIQNSGRAHHPKLFDYFDL